MEKYTMFMDQQNQYSENEYTILPKAIYRFNAIPITLPAVFFRTRTNNFTIRMEIQKTWIANAILRKKMELEESNCLTSGSTTKPHQDSMVLAQRQNYRSMGQNRKPRDKPTHLWTPYLWQRRHEYTMKKRQSL